VRRRPPWLALDERCEDLPSARSITARAPRDAENQRGTRVSRRGLENFTRLLGGKSRIALQQASGVGERDVDGSDRLCCTASTHVTNLPRPIGARACTQATLCSALR